MAALSDGDLSYYLTFTLINTTAAIINFIVLVIFYHFRDGLLNTNSNRLLLSMTVADFLVGVLGAITGILLLTKQPDIIWRLSGMIPLYGGMFTSIIMLGLLTADRFIACKWPLRYHELMTTKRTLVLIRLAWVIPILITTIQAVILICTTDKIELQVRSIFLTVVFTAGVISLTTSNWILYRIVKLQRLKLRPTIHVPSGNDGKRPTTIMKSEHKSSRMCLWIVILFIICWTPLTSYRFSALVGRKEAVPWLRRLSMCLAAGNSLLNPCVYFLKREDFREMFKRLLKIG